MVIKMENNAELIAKIKKETKYFMALVIVSLMFGGMAMAFSVAAIANNALAVTRGLDFAFVNIPLMAVGFVLAYLGIRYIISTAEVMDKFDDLRKDKIEENSTREELTSQVVKLMSLYRDEKPQIKRMISISKIAGTFFIAYAIIQTALFIVGFSPVHLFPEVIGTLLIFAFGGSGFVIPYFFKNYSFCWDKRLEMGAEAEKKIASFLEENP